MRSTGCAVQYWGITVRVLIKRNTGPTKDTMMLLSEMKESVFYGNGAYSKLKRSVTGERPWRSYA